MEENQITGLKLKRFSKAGTSKLKLCRLSLRNIYISNLMTFVKTYYKGWVIESFNTAQPIQGNDNAKF